MLDTPKSLRKEIAGFEKKAAIARAHGSNSSRLIASLAEIIADDRRNKLEGLTGKHYWDGKEMPAQVENFKEWQTTTGDWLENRLFDFFADLNHHTANKEENCDEIWDMVKQVLPYVIVAARENGIPVWYPEARSHEF